MPKYMSKFGKDWMETFKKSQPLVQNQLLDIAKESLEDPRTQGKYRARSGEASESEKINKMLDVRTPIKQREKEEEKERYKEAIKRIKKRSIKEIKERTA